MPHRRGGRARKVPYQSPFLIATPHLHRGASGVKKTAGTDLTVLDSVRLYVISE
jgi:hypothetical protein